MKAEPKHEVVVVLSLSLEEATWLKAYMQNPAKDNEDSVDTRYREALWAVLDEAGVKL